MSHEFKGILKLKNATVPVSERFQKREFVVSEDRDQYQQHISFQLSQDRCDLLDSINVGDYVNVKFNLKGREWKSPQGETKYFNTLDAWAIIKLQDETFKGETLMPEQDSGSLPF